MKKINKIENEIYDVIVFGGGVSGLTSAYKLLEKNPSLSILVLEARDRVGGRTYSIKKGNATIELGGQWFGPHHKNALDLMKKLDIELIEQYDQGVHLFQGSDGKVEKYEEENSNNPNGFDPYRPLQNLINKLETMAYNLSQEGIIKGKWSKDEKEMDQISFATWLQENSFKNECDRYGTEIITNITNSAIGAEPEEYSLLFFLSMLRSCVGYKEIMNIRDCAQHWKTVGGAQQISNKLEKIINSHLKCRVLKNAPVTSVTKMKNSPFYVVETNNKQAFRAKFCICSVPLHLQSKITFEPPLPFHRSQLSMRSPMGSIVKITVTYDNPFWKEKGLSGLVLSLCYPSSYIIDASGKDGQNPALLCFINGKCAREYSLLDDEKKKCLMITQLVSIFGEEARNYTNYIEQNWLKETYSSGCYFNVPSVGVISNFGYILRKPFDNIHFAGSETAENWFGYIEGAIESGYRCAEEINQKLLNQPKL